MLERSSGRPSCQRSGGSSATPRPTSQRSGPELILGRFRTFVSLGCSPRRHPDTAPPTRRAHPARARARRARHTTPGGGPKSTGASMAAGASEKEGLRASRRHRAARAAAGIVPAHPGGGAKGIKPERNACCRDAACAQHPDRRHGCAAAQRERGQRKPLPPSVERCRAADVMLLCVSARIRGKASAPQRQEVHHAYVAVRKSVLCTNCGGQGAASTPCASARTSVLSDRQSCSRKRTGLVQWIANTLTRVGHAALNALAVSLVATSLHCPSRTSAHASTPSTILLRRSFLVGFGNGIACVLPGRRPKLEGDRSTHTLWACTWGMRPRLGGHALGAHSPGGPTRGTHTRSFLWVSRQGSILANLRPTGAPC